MSGPQLWAAFRWDLSPLRALQRRLLLLARQSGRLRGRCLRLLRLTQLLQVRQGLFKTAKVELIGYPFHDPLSRQAEQNLARHQLERRPVVLQANLLQPQLDVVPLPFPGVQLKDILLRLLSSTGIPHHRAHPGPGLRLGTRGLLLLLLLGRLRYCRLWGKHVPGARLPAAGRPSASGILMDTQFVEGTFQAQQVPLILHLQPHLLPAQLHQQLSIHSLKLLLILLQPNALQPQLDLLSGPGRCFLIPWEERLLLGAEAPHPQPSVRSLRRV
mmetsp:Transcript_25761/g.72089  ORF Transcript_25761/g.72089 Transcript_25761/m.72089 type:complete len:272 (+) Transcript_25761:1382-2197(+)